MYSLTSISFTIALREPSKTCEFIAYTISVASMTALQLILLCSGRAGYLQTTWDAVKGIHVSREAQTDQTVLQRAIETVQFRQSLKSGNASSQQERLRPLLSVYGMLLDSCAGYHCPAPTDRVHVKAVPPRRLLIASLTSKEQVRIKYL